jgi:hypothetical protein
MREFGIYSNRFINSSSAPRSLDRPDAVAEDRDRRLPRGHVPNDFASARVTDGKHLFVSFGSGVFCFDVEGNLKWQKDFGDSRRAELRRGSCRFCLATRWSRTGIGGQSFIVVPRRNGRRSPADRDEKALATAD